MSRLLLRYAMLSPCAIAADTPLMLPLLIFYTSCHYASPIFSLLPFIAAACCRHAAIIDADAAADAAIMLSCFDIDAATLPPILLLIGFAAADFRRCRLSPLMRFAATTAIIDAAITPC